MRGPGPTLVAIDQPTIVPNATGMRPVDRVAASLVSWLGGGVQPANRGKIGMFDDAAPIWRFLAALNGIEDPEGARTAEEGLYYFEVFPALALASIGESFFGRLAAPRYNPARRKTFRKADWDRVLAAVATDARRVGCGPLAEWCDELASDRPPLKADQDKLGAAICLLVALRWRLEPREASMMIGNKESGYGGADGRKGSRKAHRGRASLAFQRSIHLIPVPRLWVGTSNAMLTRRDPRPPPMLGDREVRPTERPGLLGSKELSRGFPSVPAI